MCGILQNTYIFVRFQSQKLCTYKGLTIKYPKLFSQQMFSFFVTCYNFLQLIVKNILKRCSYKLVYYYYLTDETANL